MTAIKSQNNEDPVSQEIPMMWNGYCPESWLKGKTVRMKLNENDFFESEETGLQICVLAGVQAIILNFRGNGSFRTNPVYGDDVELGEFLSPQTTDRPLFNAGVIFQKSDEIDRFIKNI